MGKWEDELYSEHISGSRVNNRRPLDGFYNSKNPAGAPQNKGRGKGKTQHQFLDDEPVISDDSDDA